MPAIIIAALIAAVPEAVRAVQAARAMLAELRARGISGEAMHGALDVLHSTHAVAAQLLEAARAARGEGHSVPGIETLEALADEVAAMPDRAGATDHG